MNSAVSKAREAASCAVGFERIDVTGRDVAAILAFVGGLGLTIDGALLWGIGVGDVFPTAFPWTALPPLLVGLGLLLAAGAFVGYPSLGERLRITTPRLYPLGPWWVQLVAYLGIVVTSVSVFLAFFDMFSGAHANGETALLADPASADALLATGSLLVWALALYTVLTILRAIRMGQIIAARTGEDPYGRSSAPGTDGRVPLLPGTELAPARPSRAIPVLFGATLVTMLAASIAIQTLEVNSLPAPAIDWAWSQLFLPLWAAMVAGAIGTVDQGIRRLEHTYLDALKRSRTTSVLAQGP